MDNLTRLDKAILAIKNLNKKLDDLSQPIAIIGMSCTFPGADNLQAFWELLEQGRDGITDVPSDRWNNEDYYDADPEAPGKIITRKGGFVQNIQQFDAGFFNISSREAETLDPQQRMLLEQVWKALENAAISPSNLKKSDTGVFVGIAAHDYFNLLNRYLDRDKIDAYWGSGNASSTATGRISYILGLQGPNMAIETACSSSLVAVHEACKSLQRGECSLAIVGGVNAILTPELSINFSKAGMLAADGKCKTFDDKADGYVRGEGCGIVIIKRLADAQRDKDPILAVIKASGINQDGASSGLTVPNGEAQEQLMRKVLAESKLNAADLDYVECHGTGTSLGDPIEVDALGQVYGHNRDVPLKLGSVKTNIGHLEAAAGVAGLIKTVLALQHGDMPKHLNFHHLNQHIDRNFPFEIVTEHQPWISHEKKLRHAAVSSFGFSGTNAHIILEEAPAAMPREESIVLPLQQAFLISAKSKKSLEEIIHAYTIYLEACTERLEDICYTLALGRAHFNYRLALMASDKDDLLRQLKSQAIKPVEVMPVNEFAEGDLDTLVKGYLQGLQVNWNVYYQPYQNALRRVALPNYCFDTQAYWIDVTQSKKLPFGEVVHEFLGSKLPGHSHEVHYLNQLDINTLGYLKDHRIYDHVIFPGAGFIESALASGIEQWGHLPLSLSNLMLLAPLELTGKIHYEVSLTPKEGGYQGTIFSSDNGKAWIHQVDFSLNVISNPEREKVDLTELKAAMPSVGLEGFYQRLRSSGLQYGEAFQAIQEAFVQDGHALVAIKNDRIDTKGYHMHPSLLDGVFQALALVLDKETSNISYIPSRLERLDWYQPINGLVWADVTVLSHDAQSITANMSLFDESGLLLARITGFTARAIEREAFETLLPHYKPLGYYLEDYEVFDLPNLTATTTDPMLIFASDEAYESVRSIGEKAKPNGAENLDDRHVVCVYDNHFMDLVSLAKRLLTSKARSFTLITRNAFRIEIEDVIQPSHTQALGFWKSFQQESGLPCYLIDTSKEFPVHSLLELISHGILSEHQVIVRDKIWVPRLVTSEDYAIRHPRLLPPKPSMYLASDEGIDTLCWQERQPKEMREDELTIRILVTALNFRDVLKAMRLYPGEAGDFGYECVGEVIAVGSKVQSAKLGDKVIVIGAGLFGGDVIVNEIQTYQLPQNLTPEQGASLPIAFLTTNYALNELANLKKDQKVLIHAATGGVGLAAIAFAKLIGAEIYATTSLSKQAWLKDNMGIEHVYDSRNTDFGQQILADTEHRGVDVVLNSLTGKGFIESSLSCLKKGGIFLEIGKINIYSKKEMDNYRPDVSYHIIAMDNRIQDEPKKIHSEMISILTLFSESKLKALPLTTFPVTETIQAFRHLQHARQIGKVVVINHKPFVFRSDALYLVTGGTGGLGFELSNYLIEQGVKHLVLVSRRKPSHEFNQWIAEQKAHGIDVAHYSANVANIKELKPVFDVLATSKYPLKGIFHTAGVLKDGRLNTLDNEDFDLVLAPKVSGSLNLQELSLASHLDCFVMFSSVASLMGNIGQSNYAAANAFMDGLAIQRRRKGLPALSINWGPFAKVGMAASLEGQSRAQGMIPLDVKQAFRMLGKLINQSDAQLAVMQVDWSKIGIEGNTWLARMEDLQSNKQKEWLMQLNTLPANKRKEAIRTRILEIIGSVIGMKDVDNMNLVSSLAELGVDSLMATQINQQLKSQFGSEKQYALLLQGDKTVNDIVETLYENLDKVKSNVPEKGTLIVREATIQDNEKINQLIYNNIIEGEVKYTADYVQPFLQQVQYLGDSVKAIVAVVDENIVGLALLSERNTYLNGQSSKLIFVSHVFISNDYRNSNIFGELFDYANTISNNIETYAYMVDRGNDNADRLYNGMVDSRFKQTKIDVSNFLIKIYNTVKVDTRFIRSATAEDIPRIIDYYNTHPSNFNVPMVVSDFTEGKLKDIPLSSVYLYEENNQLRGVLAIADRSSEFKLVCHGYKGKMKLIYHLLKYSKKYSLLNPGQACGMAFMTLFAYDNLDVLDSLIKQAYNDLYHTKTALYLIFTAIPDKRIKKILKSYSNFSSEATLNLISTQDFGEFKMEGSIIDSWFNP